MSCLEIVKPGWLTTVQDLGRWGLQGRGVPVSGPMDPFSHRLANRLVGNPDGAATLEATMAGPDLTFDEETWFAVSGAEFPLTLDGSPVAMNEAVRARRGATLRFGMRARGTRGYLAVAGGLLVPPVLGSRATHVVARLGGLDGRAVRAGDRLTIGAATVGRPRRHAPIFELPAGGARVRVLAGPHAARFARDALDALYSSRYVVSVRSDRMGYRLDGPSILGISGMPEFVSGPTVPGAVQVPAAGQPIVLMADRATTGGYPIVAAIISADVPVVGQMAPGDWIELEPCTRDEARAALGQREEALARVA